jgi:AmmeMemoRadiSam system protein B
MIRESFLKKRWYVGYTEQEFEQLIESCFNHPQFGSGKFQAASKKTKRTILGGVIPHAGYQYSGPAASNTIQKLFSESCPDTVVILGTQHTYYRKIGIMSEGVWDTPLGKIQIDSNLANQILKETDLLSNDVDAFTSRTHWNEHNIEIQLPLIKYASNKYDKEISFVPIKFGVMDPSILKPVAISIANAIKSQSDKEIVILGSSDMSHEDAGRYGSVDQLLKYMYKTDGAIKEALSNYDADLFFERARRASVCGPQTIYTTMLACKELGAKDAIPLKYYTSFDITGTGTYVVGYLSAVFSV